jgi:hypothetical protein
MDLDTLITDADRARKITIPAGDPEEARRLRERLVAHDQRRLRYGVPATGVVVAAGAAAVVVVLASPGSSPVTPTSAAAAVLTRAAAVVADQPTLQLGGGQYLYTETRTLGLPDGFESGEGDQPFVLYPTTIQYWAGGDGSSRRAETVGGTPQFATPAAQQAWVQAGEPTPTSEFDASISEHDTTLPANGGQAPQDYSQLPTDPAALLKLIETGTTGLVVPDLSPLPPSSPTEVFHVAAYLLATPGLGAQPGLSAALYDVLAGVPGIELLGQTTDHSGRTGTAIALPGRYDRTEIIIDPSDGAMLEQSQVLTDPALEPPIFITEFGDIPGETLAWTDYLNSGIVNSTTATPQTRTPTGTPAATGATGNAGSTGGSGLTGTS